MGHRPCRERVFPLELAPEFVRFHSRYAHWLKHLLERLGRDATLEVWYSAFQGYDDTWLAKILSDGWETVPDEGLDVGNQIADSLAELFPAPVEMVSREEARWLIEKSPPLLQIRQRFPSLQARRQISTYEALHLFRDGPARLVESLIEHHGRQGEFIAYDILLDSVTAGPQATMPVADFLQLFTREPDEPTWQTAGLEYELVRASDSEVVIHIRECEWARYYREHHPEVGYLLACSMDEAEYRAAHPRIRMQRRSTIMEGGELCDFRIYAIEQDS